MFEQYTDHFWAALFAGIVFYGLWQWLRAPYLVRKFYRLNGFTDTGESALDSDGFEQSLLLNRLKAENVYTGDYKGYRVAQFAAYPEDRHKFTWNKTKRKRNQSMWTATVFYLDQQQVQFCARPTTVQAALEYVLDRSCVEFPDDERFSNKVHILAEDHQAVRDAFATSIREYLTHLDPISLESVGKLLIHLGPREPHDVGNRFQAQLDSVVEIAGVIERSS